MEKNIPLAEDFRDYFDVFLANTEQLRSAVYKIRYRVYCVEFEYEPINSFPNKEEFDEFDEHSRHCVIIHKSTGMPAGCVRLVPAAETLILPFEKYCSSSIDKEYIKKLNLDRDKVCEISRLAVDGAFRRRASEARTRFGEIDAIDCTHRERRTFSLISLAAFLSATALTELTGKKNVFAMMEPFLPRMLEKSGIFFNKAGIDIDYHGMRAPYFAKTEDAMKSMHPDLEHFYEYVFGKIESQYAN